MTNNAINKDETLKLYEINAHCNLAKAIADASPTVMRNNFLNKQTEEYIKLWFGSESNIDEKIAQKIANTITQKIEKIKQRQFKPITKNMLPDLNRISD